MLRSAPLVNKYKFIVVFSGLLAGLSHTAQAYGFNSGGGAAVEISGVVAIPDGRESQTLRVILPKGSHHSYDQGHYPILRQGGKADNSRVFRFCQPGSPLAPESPETCQSILLLSRSALEIEVRDETEAVAGDADLVSILAGSFVQLLNSAGAYLPFRPKPPELPDPGVSLPGNSPAPVNGNPDVPSFPPDWPGQNPRFLLDTKNSPPLLELFPQPVMVQQNGPEAEWQGEDAEEAVLTHFDARGGFARVQVPQDYKLVDPLQMQPEQPVRSLGFEPQAIEQRLPGGVLTEAVNSQGDIVYIIRESNGQIRILSPYQLANLMASVIYSRLEAAGLGEDYVEFKGITRPYTRPVPDQPPLKGKKPRGEPDNPSAGPVFEPETKGGGGPSQGGSSSVAQDEVVRDKAAEQKGIEQERLQGITGITKEELKEKQKLRNCQSPFENPDCLKEVSIANLTAPPEYALQYKKGQLTWIKNEPLPLASISLSNKLSDRLMCGQCMDFISGSASKGFDLFQAQRTARRVGGFFTEVCIRHVNYTMQKSNEGIDSLINLLSVPGLNPMDACQLHQQARKAGIQLSHQLISFFNDYLSDAVERQAQTELTLMARVEALEQASQQTASNHTAPVWQPVFESLREELAGVHAQVKDMHQKTVQACYESVFNLQTEINKKYEQHSSTVHVKLLEMDEGFVDVQDKLRQFQSASQTNSTEILRRFSSVDQIFFNLNVKLAEHNLRLDMLNCKNTEGVLLWKITDLERRRKDAMTGKTPSIYSQPFFTGPCGYKMCARLYLNGDGMGECVYLSLFFVVMRGEYDALLTWPFRQKVTLILMSQGQSPHISDTFRPDPSSSSFQRPKREMNIASGCPLFVPLDTLHNNDYTKGDTLFIKVIVNKNGLTAPDARP